MDRGQARERTRRRRGDHRYRLRTLPSRAGFSVSVIDQGQVGGGCSHGNCGHICTSHVLPMTEPAALREGLVSLVRRDAPFKVRPQWRLAMLWWLLQFARRCTRGRMLESARHQQAILESSRREYASLVAAGEIDGEWRGDGLLYVLRTRKGMDAFAAMDAMLRDEFGVAATPPWRATSCRRSTRRCELASRARSTTRGTHRFGPTCW